MLAQESTDALWVSERAERLAWPVAVAASTDEIFKSDFLKV